MKPLPHFPIDSLERRVQENPTRYIYLLLSAQYALRKTSNFLLDYGFKDADELINQIDDAVLINSNREPELTARECKVINFMERK